MESAAQASGFTQSATQTASVSKKRLWVGRIMSALVVLFLVFDAVLKFIKPAPVVGHEGKSTVRHDRSFRSCTAAG